MCVLRAMQGARRLLPVREGGGRGCEEQGYGKGLLCAGSHMHTSLYAMGSFGCVLCAMYKCAHCSVGVCAVCFIAHVTPEQGQPAVDLSARLCESNGLL